MHWPGVKPHRVNVYPGNSDIKDVKYELNSYGKAQFIK